jgi:F-type H+-transporting ATPase subunit delta
LASSAAKRYAQAVFSLARERGTFDQWERDLLRLNSLVADSRALTYLTSPKVSEPEKLSLLDKVLEDAQPEARNLARLLLERRRIRIIPDFLRSFHESVLEARGIAVAEVTTAVPLDAEAESMVRNRLTELIGKKIELRSHVDPAIIGGLIARVGDSLIDGSVSSRLRRLHERLSVTG